jgi:hypothetical protein
MTPRRTLLAAALAAAALLAGAPAAGASTVPLARFSLPIGLPRYPALTPLLGVPFSGGPVSAPCSAAHGGDGVGSTGGTTSVVCQGGGLIFIGPSIGQIANVIGPTIIGPAVIGNVIVSAGNGVGG